jgi:hypothetical protein
MAHGLAKASVALGAGGGATGGETTFAADASGFAGGVVGRGLGRMAAALEEATGLDSMAAPASAAVVGKGMAGGSTTARLVGSTAEGIGAEAGAGDVAATVGRRTPLLPQNVRPPIPRPTTASATRAPT